jgi:peroxiredoxin
LRQSGISAPAEIVIENAIGRNMHSTLLHLVSFAFVLTLTLGFGTSGTPSANASHLVVTDVDGHRVDLLSREMKAAVLFFVTDDCPITNSYAPAFNKIVAQYTTRGVAFCAVYTDSTLNVQEIRRHAREFDFRVPLIRDVKHSLVNRVGATVTPEVAVLERAGTLVYLGPIDDLYADFGKLRSAPSRQYLREELEAILAGKPATIAAIKPIGCFIPPEP